jgi:recombination protein RecT
MTGVQLSRTDRTSIMTLFEQGAPLKALLAKAEGSVAATIRGQMTAQSLIQAALLQVSMTPALQACDKLSIVQAVMQAASLGLMVGGPAGEAALVPYKNKAKLLPMVRGLVALAQRSRTVTSIPAWPVYKGDHFRVRLGTELVIEHEPDLGRTGSDPKDAAGDVRYVYAVVITPNGYRDPHYMTRDEVEAIRAVSQAKDKGPWVDWWIEMALKTVVKRATKRYDLSPEFRAAVELDNRFETGRINEPSSILDTAEEVEATVQERTAARTEELKNKVNGGAKKASPRTGPCPDCGSLPQEPHKSACPQADD